MQRELKVKIGEKNFLIKFPNVGQIIDIESTKQALTTNKYGAMASSGIASMYYALDIVDAISFFQIVSPEVGKYYDIKNYLSLEQDKIQDLVDTYKNQIRPWFDAQMKELKNLNNTSENGEK